MNNNIEEAYCSLEVSKILRDKGFHVYCQWSFNPRTNEPQYGQSDNTIPALARPTHALAMEWIRINFGISIDLARYYNPIKSYKKFFEVAISHEDNSYDGLMKNASDRISVDWAIEPQKYWLFNSPQEAVEAGLLYTLKNLI